MKSNRTDLISSNNDKTNFNSAREIANFNNAKVLTLSDTQKDLNIDIKSAMNDSAMIDEPEHSQHNFNDTQNLPVTRMSIEDDINLDTRHKINLMDNTFANSYSYNPTHGNY